MNRALFIFLVTMFFGNHVCAMQLKKPAATERRERQAQLEKSIHSLSERVQKNERLNTARSSWNQTFVTTLFESVGADIEKLQHEMQKKDEVIALQSKQIKSLQKNQMILVDKLQDLTELFQESGVIQKRPQLTDARDATQRRQHYADVLNPDNQDQTARVAQQAQRRTILQERMAQMFAHDSDYDSDSDDGNAVDVLINVRNFLGDILQRHAQGENVCLCGQCNQ